MRNSTQTAQPATEPCNRESLTVAFQNFNDVFLAKISNLKGKETYAFGATTAIAQQNAMRNYQTKYNS
ncbi:hypothetical protein [Kaistella sp.]|uniref:hypothetical protein n=1 Tax=Kaistella sp. TaxID=2782235 RepID=UPI002F948460